MQINPAAQSLFDISKKKALNANVMRFFEHPDSHKTLCFSITSSQPTILRHTDIRDSNHRPKLADCILTPVKTSDAEYLLLEFNEIDSRTKQALDDSMDRSQTANNAVIRGVAHEIKNPLGGLRGAAQLLDRELNEHPHLKDYTRIIVQETDRLCNLIDAMSSPQLPMNLKSENIHEILEHVRILLLAEVSNGIKIQQDYDPSLPPVLGDREQLIQAFLNIARNAIEASGEHGVLEFRTRVARQVTIDSIRHQRSARIELIDRGPGIPSDILDHVFYPMISGKANGDGLGLSIVHRIVKRHGGHISCESKPGRTCFTIHLKFSGSG